MSEIQDSVDPPVEQAVDQATVIAEPTIDPERVQAFVAELQAQQSLMGAIGGGFISSIAGAVIWAVVTVLTKYQIGWMAVGVGFLVGLAIRKYGKGLTPLYGVIGAVLSLFGCLLGNILSLGGFLAEKQGLPVMHAELMLLINPAAVAELLTATFDPRDVLFYAIAVYEGYRFSFRQISEGELAALTQ